MGRLHFKAIGLTWIVVCVAAGAWLAPPAMVDGGGSAVWVRERILWRGLLGLAVFRGGVSDCWHCVGRWLVSAEAMGGPLAAACGLTAISVLPALRSDERLWGRASRNGISWDYVRSLQLVCGMEIQTL